MQRVSLLLIVVVLLMRPSPARADGRPDTLEGAGDGHRRYAEDRLWKRRISIRELEAMALRAPRDHRILQRLAQAYLDAGFLHLARRTFERALQLVPEDPDAHFGLGRVYEREWLAAPASGSADVAMDHFARATQARPGFWEAWIALAVLRYERRNPRGAREAAVSALVSMPDRVEPQIANAYLAYRNGFIALSDSLFTFAIPRLPRGIAARFDDLSPLLTPDEAGHFGRMSPQERTEYARRFWTWNDPDPTTPQNEARLEFYSRLAHAMLLLLDPWSPRWYTRTDLYARYGRLVQINDPFDSHHDEMPHVAWGEEADTPTPKALASLGQIATKDGRAVFARLPPGTRELPIASLVSRFEGASGPRLLAQVETHGSPGDTVTADCAVLDSLRRVIARASRSLSGSSCDPTDRRAGDFVFELESGRYELAFAVYDKLNGRGVARTRQELAPVASALSMSDVVLQCGLPDRSTSQGTIRLNTNFLARLEGRQPLFAYFEIYHLRSDAKGRNRFEYEYSIHGIGADGRSSERLRHSAAMAASQPAFRSMQEGVGALRRQFITVPTESTPPGRYRLTILVRDILAGTKTEQSVDFVKSR
jgi:GWxTD domain-containing protein